MRLLIVLLALGCGEAPPPAAPPDPVAVAAEIARAVDADPGSADAVLAAHGMTQAQLEALMFEIAADPEKTAAFEAARAGTAR